MGGVNKKSGKRKITWGTHWWLLIAAKEHDHATRLRVTGPLPPHSFPTNLSLSLFCPNPLSPLFHFHSITNSIRHSQFLIFQFYSFPILFHHLGKQIHFPLSPYIYILPLFYLILGISLCSVWLVSIVEIKIGNLTYCFLPLSVFGW